MCRRYNYTTPKSYLDLISLYKQLLVDKREQLRLAKLRLETGVEKITVVNRQRLPSCHYCNALLNCLTIWNAGLKRSGELAEDLAGRAADCGGEKSKNSGIRKIMRVFKY